MNILLIEDDPTDMKLFSAVLIDGGHTVCEKISAEQAIAEIRSRQPELILVDLKLPRMDGLTLVQMLKSAPETWSIPVIAMTAAPEEFTRQAALAAGCSAFIQKPIDTRALATQVESVMLKSHS
jgi:two-component system, cell cycle response regulator